MDKPKIKKLSVVNWLYEAIVVCKKCDKETIIKFFKSDAEIKHEYKSDEIARRYVETVASPVCAECKFIDG